MLLYVEIMNHFVVEMTIYELSRIVFFFFSSRRRHTRLQGDWSSDVCSSDLEADASFDHLVDESVEPIADHDLLELLASEPAKRFDVFLPGLLDDIGGQRGRSGERRVGGECRYRWSPDHLKKKKREYVYGRVQ